MSSFFFFKFIQKTTLKFVATWIIKNKKMSMLNMALHFQFIYNNKLQL